MYEIKELLEKMAELEHDQWINWSKEITKTEKISKDREERWRSLWIPYGELTEEYEEYDRIWARKTLDLFEDEKICLLKRVLNIKEVEEEE